MPPTPRGSSRRSAVLPDPVAPSAFRAHAAIAVTDAPGRIVPDFNFGGFTPVAGPAEVFTPEIFTPPVLREACGAEAGVLPGPGTHPVVVPLRPVPGATVRCTGRPAHEPSPQEISR